MVFRQNGVPLSKKPEKHKTPSPCSAPYAFTSKKEAFGLAGLFSYFFLSFFGAALPSQPSLFLREASDSHAKANVFKGPFYFFSLLAVVVEMPLREVP